MSHQLVETAKRIAPELGETIAEDNRLRRLCDSTWKILLDNGFLRSLQPARWGGGEVPLLEFVDAMMELARVSPSAGWVAGVIGVHPWQLALFGEKAQQEVWRKDPETMQSSSYNPTGKAEKVAGGYKLSGRWSFSSGSDHCRGVILGGICGSREVLGKSVPDFRSFLLLGDQYRIDDNWYVAGLKGTGSKDIVVEGAFVPEYRSQSHIDYAMGLSLPGQERPRAQVFVDGKSIGEVPLRSSVAIGKHAVEVRTADGRFTARQEVTVRPRGHAEINAQLKEAAPSASAAKAEGAGESTRPFADIRGTLDPFRSGNNVGFEVGGGLEYGHFRASLSAILFPDFGTDLRGALNVPLVDSFNAYISVEIPVIFASPTQFGLGGAGGLEYEFRRWFDPFFEIGVRHLFTGQGNDDPNRLILQFGIRLKVP